MSVGRTHVREGTRVLTDNGTGVVVSVDSSGYVIRDAFGELEPVGWLDAATVREIGGSSEKRNEWGDADLPSVLR
jgi:putative transposase